MFNERTHKSRMVRGSALAYALVIMTAVMILLSSITTFIVSQLKNSFYVNAREESFQIAESGIQYYKWYLAHQTDGRTVQQIEAFWNSESVVGVGMPYTASYVDLSGTEIGHFRITVTPPVHGSTSVTVQSVGWTNKYPSNTRTIQVRFRRPSWSERAVIANDFMRFGEGTEISGKIHVNQGTRFDGLAHNLITSYVSTVDDPDHNGGVEFGVHTHVNPPPGTGVDNSFRPLEAPPNSAQPRSDIFQAGRKFPVAYIDFNGVLGDLSYMKSEAQAGRGKYFDNSGSGRSITLKTDGTFDVCTVNSFSTTTNIISNYKGIVAGATGSSSGTNGSSCTAWTCCEYASCGWIQPSKQSRGKCVSQSNYPLVDNGVVFVENNIWLSGQISGRKISIVAANLIGGVSPSVFIPNDITYTNYDGSDILGIIGQQDIEIPQNSDTNLRIDGALLAQQGRVGMKHYGVVKSSIIVYGALATKQRYGFAWTDNTGYQTRDIVYDNNLLYYPSPYFPTGTQYAIDLWEER